MTGPAYVGVTASLAGNTLYFTDSDSFSLLATPYRRNAAEFHTFDACAQAIAPWNALGWNWTVTIA